MNKRFDYVQFDEETAEICEASKEMFSAVADAIESLEVTGQANRAKALALTKLEESFMWVGKMLRDQQIAMNGFSEHLPERNDS